jgi:hypothetical protein
MSGLPWGSQARRACRGGGGWALQAVHQRHSNSAGSSQARTRRSARGQPRHGRGHAGSRFATVSPPARRTGRWRHPGGAPGPWCPVATRGSRPTSRRRTRTAPASSGGGWRRRRAPGIGSSPGWSGAACPAARPRCAARRGAPPRRDRPADAAASFPDTTSPGTGAGPGRPWRRPGAAHGRDRRDQPPPPAPTRSPDARRGRGALERVMDFGRCRGRFQGTRRAFRRVVRPRHRTRVGTVRAGATRYGHKENRPMMPRHHPLQTFCQVHHTL